MNNATEQHYISVLLTACPFDQLENHIEDIATGARTIGLEIYSGDGEWIECYKQKGKLIGQRSTITEYTNDLALANKVLSFLQSHDHVDKADLTTITEDDNESVFNSPEGA